jgi:hypothetical protein
MRRLAPILVLLALAALTAVALARVGDAPAARATATAASGSFELTNSGDGEPIFSAANIAPGGSAAGTVTIEATGSGAAAIVLRRGDVLDTPGLGGGVLSERLRLSVVDITAPTAPRTVYTGPLASMPEQRTGELEPGEARTFEFTATLPDGGEPAIQNAVQGASTTVAYTWVAEEPTGSGGGDEGGGYDEEGGAPPGGGGGSSGDGGGSPGGVTDTRTSPGPDGTDGAAGRPAVLNLIVPRVRSVLHGGRLVVWANCDDACRLTVRGRLRATAAARHRGAPIRFAQKRPQAAGPRRLRIPVPPGLRRWLRRGACAPGCASPPSAPKAGATPCARSCGSASAGTERRLERPGRGPAADDP